jgi:erythromycin esterase
VCLSTEKVVFLCLTFKFTVPKISKSKKVRERVTLIMGEGTDYLRGEIIAGLQNHAIPFTTAQPGSSFDDLLPLKQLIGDARIVALGEATHGTREFFLMKHRLLEFLVKEMNFNVFAIEASWAEANLINEYVHTGKGDPTQLLAGLHFWTWDTQEVLDMILWMRAHNQAPGNTSPVSFRGFDMQYSRMAIENVISYLHNVALEAEQKVETLYAPFQQYADDQEGYNGLPLKTKSQCRSNLQYVYDLLLQHRAIYEGVSSSEMFAHALQSARIVLQAENVFTSNGDGSRDLYMAENVSWLLEQAGSKAKMVLWAHNGHIGKKSRSGESMGVHLHKRYIDAMVTFGFSFYQGSLNAVNSQRASRGMLIPHEAPPPPEESYEHTLGALGMPQFFLDLRNIRAGSAAADWLVGPHLCRSIGAVYAAAHPENYFDDISLPEEYDVIIHLQDTTPSMLLPSVNQGEERIIAPRKPRNLNFESRWAGWDMMGSHPHDYEREIEQPNEPDIEIWFASKADGSSGFVAFAQTIDADEYHGKQLRMAADMKSQEVEEWAGLWMRVDGPDDEVQSFDNMYDRGITGGTDWTRYEIVLPVFADSQGIMFGVLLVGKGKIWLRNVQIQIVD